MLRFYQSWFPELAHFEDDDDRRRAFTRARNRASGLRSMAWGIPLVLAAYFILILYVAPLISQRTGLPNSMVRAITYFVFYLVTGICALWLTRRSIQRHLRTELVNAGLPICISCGFDLHAQESPRCPECGTAFNFDDFDPSRLQRNTAPGEMPNSLPIKCLPPQRPQTRWSFLHTEIPHSACVAAAWTLVVLLATAWVYIYIVRG